MFVTQTNLKKYLFMHACMLWNNSENNHIILHILLFIANDSNGRYILNNIYKSYNIFTHDLTVASH